MISLCKKMIKVISIETKFGWISAFEKKSKIYRVKFGKHKNKSRSKNLGIFKKKPKFVFIWKK